jgi:peptide subunit release factor 1 (eRF1)
MQKHYFCGKKLLTFSARKAVVYTILLVDLSQCVCADIYSDGEIKVLLEEHSAVPHKMKKGGQSAERFARERDNQITLWYKRIDEYLKNIPRDITLGIQFHIKKRFLRTMSTYNENKIKNICKTEYCNCAGIYQFVNRMKEKKLSFCADD